MLRKSKKKKRCLSESSSLQHSSPMLTRKDTMQATKFLKEQDSSDSQKPSTVESIVLQCAECFDDKTGHCKRMELPKKLFLIHLWFMTSEQLMFLFKQLYVDSEHNPSLQKKVLHAVAFWMMEYPFIFDLDASVARALGDLQAIVAQGDKGNEKIINLQERCSYKWMSAKQMSIRPNLGSQRKRKLSLVFNHLEPQDLAIHISYLEYKCFRRLTVDDFHNYAMRGTIKGNLKLERAVILFNNITHWVQCMVLKETIPHERAQAVKKFVDVARYLLKMHNYNTMLAIIGALTHTTISRLRKTTAELPKDTIKELEGYIELMDSKSNYSAYRRSFSAVTDHFKIPILGVVLKDLIAIHTANPDRIGEGLINVKKMFTLGNLFQELLGLQLKKTQYPFEVNTDLVNTLQGSLYLNYSENEIYQLSLNREPKESRFKLGGSKPYLELNNLRFAEFTRYTCQLDQEIVKQHVEAMVKSVFKTYDTDKDGSLSEDDYGLLSLNFPALDPFSTVDKNKDGKICMTELMEYLMLSSSRRKEVCLSFQHTFVETTYRSLTFCDQCKKLMWGIVKQGWKCKECGINCHKYCKSRIVQECRRKVREMSSEGTAPHNKHTASPDESTSELLPRKGSQPMAPDIIVEKPLRKWRSANDGMNVVEPPSSPMGSKLKNIVTKYVDKKRIKRRMSTNTRTHMKSSTSLASGLKSLSKTSLDVFSPIASDTQSLSIPSPSSDTVFVMDTPSAKDHRDSGFGGCSTPSGSSCTSLPSPSDGSGRFFFPSTSSVTNTRDQTPCSCHEIIVNTSNNDTKEIAKNKQNMSSDQM